MDHLSDDQIESYSLGRLGDPALGQAEEHLLVCASCQDRLNVEDRFTSAAKAALTHEIPTSARRMSWRNSFAQRWSGLALGGALAVAASIMLTFMLRPNGSQTVELIARRGSEVSGKARAGTPLRLELQAEGVLPGTYSAEIADAAGNIVWRMPDTVLNPPFSVDVPVRLTAGRYWVRLFQSPERATPSREFSLQLE